MTNPVKLKVKKLDRNALMPFKVHKYDAGYDLYSIGIRKTELYDEHLTGLSIEIPNGYVGLLFPRSSITNYSMMLKNCVGIIDAGYTGEIRLRFERTSNFGNFYKKGDRVGQLVVLKLPEVELEEVKLTSVSDRGDSGFGGSGR